MNDNKIIMLLLRNKEIQDRVQHKTRKSKAKNKIRVESVVMSTVLAAVGIVVYQQSFGFVQLYLAPFYMAFPAIAAILIGGASVNKVTIVNVVVGTFLFQGILTMTPSVVNNIIQTDMSETIRIIVSNGMILYALTRKEGAGSGK
jgi:simple sugar transport system permease protein